MKALSIRQPWAWLIVHGPKRIENRIWFTRHRGPLLIHASRYYMRGGYQATARMVRETYGVELPPRGELSFGGIIGRCVLVDVVRESEDPWFEGPLGFVLDKVEAVAFCAVEGKLRLFDVDPAILKKEPAGKGSIKAKAKAKTKAADKMAPAGQGAKAKRAGKLTDDERARLRTAYAELGAAEEAYRDASKDKKAAQDALAKLVAEICEGQGPLFDGKQEADGKTI